MKQLEKSDLSNQVTENYKVQESDGFLFISSDKDYPITENEMNEIIENFRGEQIFGDPTNVFFVTTAMERKVIEFDVVDQDLNVITSFFLT